MNRMAQNGWPPGREYAARPAARHDTPAEAHVGTPEDLVGRLQAAARKASQTNSPTRADFVEHLFSYATDERNLMVALQHQEANGGSPGIDGLSFADLPSRDQRWPLLRAIRDNLRDGSYRPLPLRVKNVPKSSGTGTRTLHIPTIIDRTVGSAIAQAAGPLLDARFAETSFGYRPNRDRRHALACAEAIAKRHDHWVWVAMDIPNAFPSVPRSRLIDIVRRYIPNEKLVELISLLIKTNSKRGIPQGQPVSSLLFNLYLHHLLDRVLQTRHPEIHLLRSSDDLLLLCKSERDATRDSGIILETLQKANLPPPKDVALAIRDLRTNGKVEWLGFQASRESESLGLTIAQRSWKKLETNLHSKHEEPDAPLRARQVLDGWLYQMSPAIREENADATMAHATQIAANLAFEELPTLNQLTGTIQHGRAAWQAIRAEQLQTQIPCLTGGSAAQVDFPAAVPCRAGVVQAPAPPAAANSFLLHTDGCCLDSHVGGWAYSVTGGSDKRNRMGSGADADTTNNRMELLAAIYGLASLPESVAVTLVTDSKYVHDGIAHHLPRWIDCDWRTSSRGRKVKNADLWKRLDDEIRKRIVSVAHVAGHSGDPGNELCDHLAKTAAVEYLRILSATNTDCSNVEASES